MDINLFNFTLGLELMLPFIMFNKYAPNFWQFFDTAISSDLINFPIL